MATRGSPGYRFIKAPPKAYMRRVKPDSASRLFEWLVDRGIAEPVTTIRSNRGFSVYRKGQRDMGNHGRHGTRAAAEKRIGRLVSMSRGKLRRGDFEID